MGQVLHGSATTTEAVRRAIQHSQESLRTLAKRYRINPKTVAKWKKRGSVADLPTGPREPRLMPPPSCAPRWEPGDSTRTRSLRSWLPRGTASPDGGSGPQGSRLAR